MDVIIGPAVKSGVGSPGMVIQEKKLEYLFIKYLLSDYHILMINSRCTLSTWHHVYHIVDVPPKWQVLLLQVQLY